MRQDTQPLTTTTIITTTTKKKQQRTEATASIRTELKKEEGKKKALALSTMRTEAHFFFSSLSLSFFYFLSPDSDFLRRSTTS